MNPIKRERDLAKMLIGGADSVITDWVQAGHLTEEDRSAQRLAVLRGALEVEIGKQGITVERVFEAQE